MKVNLAMGLLVLLPLVGVLYAVQDAKPITVMSLPPVVVKTVPVSGDTAVDASKVTELRVTFSKPMADKSWSWSQISDATALPIHGDIKYDADGRTCIAPVKLEPGKTYVSWLNSEKFSNFKDKDGRPYLTCSCLRRSQRGEPAGSRGD